MFPSHLAQQAKYAIIDLETGGLDPQKNKLLTVAVVLLDEKGEKLASRSVLVNDLNRKYEPATTGVHGFTATQIADIEQNKPIQVNVGGTQLQMQPQPLESVIADLRDLTTNPDMIWVGHNAARFDLQFLAARGLYIPRVLDTLTLAQGLMGRAGAASRQGRAVGSFKLGDIYQGMTGKPLAGAHDALADAEATGTLLREFLSANPYIQPQNVDNRYQSNYVQAGVQAGPLARVIDAPQIAALLVQKYGGNLTAAVNEMESAMQIRTPEVQSEIINRMALLRPDLFENLSPSRQAREVYKADFWNPNDPSQPMVMRSQTLARFPEAFRGEQGQYYGQREAHQTGGFDIERMWAAGQGIVSFNTGDDWEVASFKHNIVLPFPSPTTFAQEAANAAQIFKTVKHLHGASGPHQMAALTDAANSMQVVNSPFVKKYASGEAIRAEQANIVNMGIVSTYKSGRVVANEDAGLRAGNKQTVFLAGVTNATQIPIGTWFTGREAQKYFGPGAVLDMDDYQTMQVLERRYDPLRGGMVVTIERQVDVAGTTKLHAYGMKGMIGGSASLAAGGPLDPDLEAALRKGAHFVADFDAVKNPFAFMEGLIGARVLRKGGKSYLTQLGLDAIWDDARGGINWDEAWSHSAVAGQTTWNGAFPDHYKRAIQSLAFEAVADPDNWTGKDNTGAFVAPMLQQITREGAYSAGKPRINIEMAARIKNIDHEMYKRMIADSKSLRNVYGEVVNNALLNAGENVAPSAEFVDLDEDSGRALLSKARLLAGTSTGDPRQNFVEALRQVMQDAGKSQDMRFAATIGDRTVWLPSVRNMTYFGGPHWKDDMAGDWGGDTAGAGRERAEMRETIAPFATSAVDLLSDIATGSAVAPDRLDRFFRNQQEMATAREVQRNLTGFRVRGSWVGQIGGDESIPMDTMLIGDEALADLLGLGGDDPLRTKKIAAAKVRLNQGDVSALGFREPNITDLQVFPGLRIMSTDRLRGFQSDAGRGSVTNSPFRVLINPRLAGKLGGDQDGDMLAAILRGRMEYDEQNDRYNYYGARPLGTHDILQRGADLNRATYSMEDYDSYGKWAHIKGGLGTAEERKWRDDTRKFQRDNHGSLYEFFQGMVSDMGDPKHLSGSQIQGAYGHYTGSRESMEQTYNMARKLAALSGGDSEYSQMILPLYQAAIDFEGNSDATRKFMRMYESFQPATGSMENEDPRRPRTAGNRNLNTDALNYAEAILAAPEFGNKETLLRMILGQRVVARLGPEQMRQMAAQARSGSLDLSLITGNDMWEQAVHYGPLMQLFRADSTRRWKSKDFYRENFGERSAQSVNEMDEVMDRPWADMGEALASGVSVIGGNVKGRGVSGGATPYEALQTSAETMLAMYRKGVYSPQMAGIMHNLIDPLVGDYTQQVMHRLDPLKAKIQALTGAPNFWNDHLEALDPGPGMMWAKIMKGPERQILTALEGDPEKSREVLGWAQGRLGRMMGDTGKRNYVSAAFGTAAAAGAGRVLSGEDAELLGDLAGTPGTDEGPAEPMVGAASGTSTHLDDTLFSASFMSRKYGAGGLTGEAGKSLNRVARRVLNYARKQGWISHTDIKAQGGTTIHNAISEGFNKVGSPNVYSEMGVLGSVMGLGEERSVSASLDLLNFTQDKAGDWQYETGDFKTGERYDTADPENWKQQSFEAMLIEQVKAGKAVFRASVPKGHADYDRQQKIADDLTARVRLQQPTYKGGAIYTRTPAVGGVMDVWEKGGSVTKSRLEAAAAQMAAATPAYRKAADMPAIDQGELDAATADALQADRLIAADPAKTEEYARDMNGRIRTYDTRDQMDAAADLVQKLQDPTHAFKPFYGARPRSGPERAEGGPGRGGTTDDFGGSRQFYTFSNQDLAARYGQTMAGFMGGTPQRAGSNVPAGQVDWEYLEQGTSKDALPFTNPYAMRSMQVLESVASGTLHPSSRGSTVVDAFTKAQAFLKANAGQMGELGQRFLPGGDMENGVQGLLNQYYKFGGRRPLGMGGAGGFSDSLADVGDDAPQAIKDVSGKFRKLSGLTETVAGHMQALAESTEGLTKATGRQKRYFDKAAELQGEIVGAMSTYGDILGSRSVPSSGADPRYQALQQADQGLMHATAAVGGMGEAPPRQPFDWLLDKFGGGGGGGGGGGAGSRGGETGITGFMDKLTNGFRLFYYHRIAELAGGEMGKGLTAYERQSMADVSGLFKAGMADSFAPAQASMMSYQNTSARTTSNLGNQTWATYGPLLSGLAGNNGVVNPAASFGIQAGLPALGGALLANAVGDAAGIGSATLSTAFPLVAAGLAAGAGALWMSGQSSPANAPGRYSAMMAGGVEGGMGKALPIGSMLSGNGFFEGFGRVGKQITYDWNSLMASPGEQLLAAGVRSSIDSIASGGGLGFLGGMDPDARASAVQTVASRYFPTMTPEMAASFVPQLAFLAKSGVNLNLDQMQSLGFSAQMGNNWMALGQSIAQTQGVGAYNFAAQGPMYAQVASMNGVEQTRYQGLYQQYGTDVSIANRLNVYGATMSNGTPAGLTVNGPVSANQRATNPYIDPSVRAATGGGATMLTDTRSLGQGGYRSRAGTPAVMASNEYLDWANRNPYQADWYKGMMATSLSSEQAGFGPNVLPDFRTLTGTPTSDQYATSTMDQATLGYQSGFYSQAANWGDTGLGQKLGVLAKSGADGAQAAQDAVQFNNRVMALKSNQASLNIPMSGLQPNQSGAPSSGDWAQLNQEEASAQPAALYHSQVQSLMATRARLGRPASNLPLTPMGGPSSYNWAGLNQEQYNTQRVQGAYDFGMQYSQGFAQNLSALADSGPQGQFQLQVIQQAMQGPGNALSSLVASGQMSGSFAGQAGIPGFGVDYARTVQTGGLTGTPGLPLGTTSVYNPQGQITQQYRQPIAAAITQGGYAGRMASALLGNQSIVNQLSPIQLAGWGNDTPGGMLLMQQTAANDSYNSQMAGLGIQAASANLSYAFQTGVGLQGKTVGYPGYNGPAGVQVSSQWSIEDRSRILQREQQAYALGMDLNGNPDPNSGYARQRALKLSQFGENFGMEQRGLGLQWSQQQQNFGLQRESMDLSRTFQKQDFSYSTAARDLSYGFQMRDDNIAIQRSTGFDRRQLERQKEEQTAGYNLETAHQRTQQTQATQQWKEEDKRFAVEKKQADELHKLAEDRLQLEKKHFMENYALEDLTATKQREWTKEQWGLDDETRNNERTFTADQHKLQMAAIGNQMTQLKNQNTQRQIQDAIDQTNTRQESTLKYLFDTSWEWANAMQMYMKQLAAIARAGGNGNVSQYVPGNGGGGGKRPGAQDGQNAAGFHGYVTAGRDLSVAENGPEWVDVYPLGAGRRQSLSAPSAGGAPVVHVYIDSTEVSKRVELRQAQQIYRGRRR